MKRHMAVLVARHQNWIWEVRLLIHRVRKVLSFQTDSPMLTILCGQTIPAYIKSKGGGQEGGCASSAITDSDSLLLCAREEQHALFTTPNRAVFANEVTRVDL